MFQVNSLKRKAVVILCVLLSTMLTLTSRIAAADAVILDAKATGKFGAFGGVVDEKSLDLVKAYVFTSPGRITLRVEGKVTLAMDNPRFVGVGPKGLSYPRYDSKCYLPLEEALVDAKGMAALAPGFNDGGAVFGAFVPEAIVNTPGFRPINSDFPNGGIAADMLFLVAEGLEFSAKEPGTLYLGINDCRPHNNSGSFKVKISLKGPSSS